jgi:hypothetical protein
MMVYLEETRWRTIYGYAVVITRTDVEAQCYNWYC